MNVDLNEMEIQFILLALEKQVEWGGRVEVLREYISLIDKISSLLFEETTANE